VVPTGIEPAGRSQSPKLPVPKTSLAPSGQVDGRRPIPGSPCNEPCNTVVAWWRIWTRLVVGPLRLRRCSEVYSGVSMYPDVLARAGVRVPSRRVDPRRRVAQPMPRPTRCLPHLRTPSTGMGTLGSSASRSAASPGRPGRDDVTLSRLCLTESSWAGKGPVHGRDWGF
jgi:hypothetical protein